MQQEGVWARRRLGGWRQRDGSPLVGRALPALAPLLLFVGMCGVRRSSEGDRQPDFATLLGRQQRQ